MIGTRIKIANIHRDMLLQPRAELHRDWIEDYAADMMAGAKLPPVVVFFDGEDYWLADGFHRIYAAEACNMDAVRADVREGSRRDALMHSLSANSEHGYRRTNEDKRRAVDIMLDDPEWSRLKDHEIAAICLVHQTFVSRRIKDRNITVAKADAKHHEPEAKREAPVTLYETPAPPLDELGQEAETSAEARAYEAAKHTEPFDWDAAKLRNTAMEAIRALAKMPQPAEVIAAWNKSSSYGEPIETLEDALAWLEGFAELYRDAEPKRWARIRPTVQEGEVAYAAE